MRLNLKKIVDSIVPPWLKRVHEATQPETEEITEGYSSPEASENPHPYPGQYNRWDWRRISDDFFSSDTFDLENFRSILKRAYHAWCTNPLAGHIVHLTTWFVMGKGLGFTARDPRVQEILKKFWNDSVNNMHQFQQWMSNELQIYGEIFIRLFRNPVDGSIRIALVDPTEIADIATDPDDIRKPIAYLREYHKSVPASSLISEFLGSTGTWSPRSDELEREVIDAGDIIHVKVNNVSNARRGMSELYRILPWLDALDRWLRDRMAINRARGTFAFLRKVPTHPDRATGPFNTDSDGKYVMPKPGSILVVHEGEDWSVLAPKVGAGDAKEDGRAIKLMIAAGSGIFEHYLGDPSTGNLATTRSMELPIVKKFEDRQRLFEAVFQEIFRKVIESAIDAGTLPRRADTSVEVNFPPIVPDDVALLTSTLVDQVNAGLLSKDSARRMIPWIGDPSKEAETIMDEAGIANQKRD